MSLKKKESGKILISACLLAENVRYNQVPIDSVSPILIFFLKKGLLVPVCPEVEGGLTVPRQPAEIQKVESNNQKDRLIVVKNSEETDVSREFHLGAKKALQMCLKQSCKMAIFKERSPSCGVHYIYDGNFTGSLITGMGRTARLLIDHEISVFSEDQLDEAYRFWFANY